MKRFFRIIFTTTLSCLCLFGTACTQKSECRTNAVNDNTVVTQENPSDVQKETGCPETLPARPPKCPDIPQEPNDSREKKAEETDDKDDGSEDDQHRHVRPMPIRRGAPKRFPPIEIFFKDGDKEKIIRVIFSFGD